MFYELASLKGDDVEIIMKGWTEKELVFIYIGIPIIWMLRNAHFFVILSHGYFFKSLIFMFLKPQVFQCPPDLKVGSQWVFSDETLTTNFP